MSGPASNPDSLHKLERLRALLLEQAQVEHARAAGEAESKRRVLQQTESDVAESQTFAREQLLRSQRVSADALLRIQQFAALQDEQLKAAHEAWRTSQGQSADALDKVIECFAELSVIERLRARRRIEAGKTQARVEQKRLDEQGLAHLAAGNCTVTTGNGR